MYLAPLVTAGVKFLGSKMGVRLILLLVVGLGALYTIHLLAQDWMKIQAGSRAAASFLLGKRDVESVERQVNITKEEIEFEEKIEWNKILNRDPFSCALSLFCQLAAGAAKNNEEANRIYEFITHTIEHTKVPKKVKKSYDQGLKYNLNRKDDFKKCYKNYPLCPYSAETMMMLISQLNSFNKFVFG